MLKQVAILSGVLIMSGCTAMSEYGHCDPKLNYIKSNIPEMQEYSELKKEGKIDSIYYEYEGPQTCEENKCFSLNQKEYLFFEISFNKKDNNDFYKITKNTNTNDKCFSNVINSECISIEKNRIGSIESRYKLTLDDRSEKNVIIRFEDIKNNKLLYEKSYQIYSTGGLGGPSGTYCSESYVQNPNYKFDVGSFSNDGIITKIKE